uniref:Uncharacterized protein n=1 Tax=Roseihalotalea indica TaxID=2867963 RepID=A0AA49GL88_9BACT|nr:hypothetical protein K4G66_25925 [Tunicatimonas sp. TK19036]
MALWVGSAPTATAQSKKSSLPTVKVPKKKKKVKRVKQNRKDKKVRDKSSTPRTKKSGFGGGQSYQSPRSKSTDWNNRDRYRRPRSKSISRKARDNYKQPRSKKNSGKVDDLYRRPPTLSPSGTVRDRYNPPRTRSHSEKVRDGYKLPETISPSGKVRATRGLEQPPIEEGQEKAHLPFIDRIFTNNRFLKKKEKALEKSSAQTTNYQGRQKSKTLNAKTRHYEKTDREQAKVVNGYRTYTRWQKKKIEKNYSRYVHQNGGYLRVPTPKAKSRYFEKLAHKVHEYNGTIKRRKPGKDMHPSVDYLTAKQKNTYEKKEKYRKRRLWLSHIFKSKDQPKHLKEKTRKPRYDKKEAEIWYY